jgi:hypothetical protein
MLLNKPTPVPRLSFTNETLSGPQKKEMERQNQYSKENTIQHFDALSSNFDSIMDRVGYPDPQKVADAVTSIT